MTLENIVKNHEKYKKHDTTTLYGKEDGATTSTNRHRKLNSLVRSKAEQSSGWLFFQ